MTMDTDMPEMDMAEHHAAEDTQYFDSYSGAEVHRMMLADRSRTVGYGDGIAAVVKPGMTVLDVGAGTGILSFFSARAGAEKVYAVDRSDILSVTEELVEVNGFTGIIECVDGVAEDIDLPGKVDVIVSEWMGMFALTEAMFESVCRARDKHLKPGGTMIPSRIKMCFTPVQEDQLYNQHGLGFWTDSLYGFDYTPMINAEIADLDTNSVEGNKAIALGPAVELVDIDCVADPIEKYWFDAHVTVEITSSGRLHGFLGHFEAELGPGIVLSTAHDKPMTHWRQSWFPIREREVEAGDTIIMHVKARKDPTGMDLRKPTYFMEGEWMRDGVQIEKFFYCHHGTYE
ncbi:MAG: 2-polyprenyl-3-methyl-5-hydroxy-6-metoxy-1,4-benzoquinol methylase [Planctomycetota bacterium]|jgi:2-polyprenyl-3-methyl-5-hydroxy-6-metoxy-1,4-benzoquinol methylase